MNCQSCDGQVKKFGKDRKGNQRVRCLACGKTQAVPNAKSLSGGERGSVCKHLAATAVVQIGIAAWRLSH